MPEKKLDPAQEPLPTLVVLTSGGFPGLPLFIMIPLSTETESHPERIILGKFIPDFCTKPLQRGPNRKSNHPNVLHGHIWQLYQRYSGTTTRGNQVED